MHGELRYTRIAIALHWVVAVLILANLVLVWVVDALPEDFTRPIVDAHKSIGITVLGLGLLRLLWRAGHPPPPLPAGYPRIERIGAHAAHVGLYALILGLPLSGWLHDSAWEGAATHPMRLFGLVPWPRVWLLTDLDPVTRERMHDLLFQVHASLAYVLYALVALHVAGALKHQFWDGEAELQRMLPGARE